MQSRSFRRVFTREMAIGTQRTSSKRTFCNMQDFKKQLLVHINVYPCPWESDKEVTNGQRIHYRAGVELDANGRTRVKRYNIGSRGPLHETLYETAHGAVKMTRPLFENSRGKRRRRIDQEYVYVMFKFPKKYGLALTKSLYQEKQTRLCLSSRHERRKRYGSN